MSTKEDKINETNINRTKLNTDNTNTTTKITYLIKWMNTLK